VTYFLRTGPTPVAGEWLWVDLDLVDMAQAERIALRQFSRKDRCLRVSVCRVRCLEWRAHNASEVRHFVSGPPAGNRNWVIVSHLRRLFLRVIPPTPHAVG